MRHRSRTKMLDTRRAQQTDYGTPPNIESSLNYIQVPHFRVQRRTHLIQARANLQQPPDADEKLCPNKLKIAGETGSRAWNHANLISAPTSDTADQYLHSFFGRTH
jgi:hypothetical protein